MTNRERHRRVMICIGLLVACFLFCEPRDSHKSVGDDIVFPLANASQDDPLAKEREASMDEVSARELNAFHLALLGRCLLQLRNNAGLTVQYQGIVMDAGGVWTGEGTGLRRLWRGQRAVGSIGHPLEWSVIDKNGFVVFSIWISVRRTRETVGECPLAKRTLFVNIEGAGRDRQELEKPRDELGGQSILQVVELLQQGPSDLETP